MLQQDARDAVVVAFTTPRCPHCAALKPHLEKRATGVRDASEGRWTSWRWTAREAREVCAWQRATRFPTIKYYVAGDGDELGREYGTSRAATYDALATFAEHHLERARD